MPARVGFGCRVKRALTPLLRLYIAMFHILAARQFLGMGTEMFDYSSKLTQLGYRQFEDANDVADCSALSLIERFQLKVPVDYQEFLRSFPLTGVFDKKVVFSGIETSPWAANGNEVLEVFYGCCTNKNNDLMKVREQYLTQVPAYFLVIGQVTGANLICLDMRPASFGYVYLWDHEHLGSDLESFYLVAKSFTSFIESLQLGDDHLAVGSPKLVKMDLSDTLKARIADMKSKQGKS